MNESALSDFIKKNSWSLIVSLVVLGSFTAMVQFRIADIQAQAMETQAEVDKLTQLVERVIILEQREERLQQDIGEIKDDVKTLLRDRGIEQ